MRQDPDHARSFWLTILLFTFIVNIVVLQRSLIRWDELGVALHRSVWGGMLLVYIGVIIACIWAFSELFRSGKLPFRVPKIFNLSRYDSLPWQILGLAIYLAILFAIPYIKFTFQIGWDSKESKLDFVVASILYYWMCWWALLLAMASLKIAFRTTWQGGFAYALIILGVAYEILTRFNAVTTYPLSMGWSEGSRYYYASLYFSGLIYGDSFPLSPLHPTRYLLQSIPFLIPGLGLTAHRFWQFLLWIGLTSAAGIALAKRVTLYQERAVRWLFAGWFFLFLLRVGVHYHLEVIVITCLLFISVKHPWRTLITVIGASIWAGLSRVNWFPMPAMIAVVLYLLETPIGFSKTDSNIRSFKGISNYLLWPMIWTGAGLFSAIGAQAIYIPLSGNSGNAQAFTSSLTSDLLWYRLWPNANHALGIVPAIMLVSGPLIATIFLATLQWKSFHPIRWLGLFSIITTFFAGSLIVSAKIGGGGDLHNMDTYAVLIGIIAAYFIFGRAQSEPGTEQLKIISWPLLTTGVLMPILFLIPLLSPYPKYDESTNQEAYRQLVNAVNAIKKNGPILFINDRQLVTFGDVDVPLVYDYEAVTLMEMAMSGNQAYLDMFHDDLANHRFAAIVVSKQNLIIKQTGPLVEENNVWNSRVSPYILCYYHPILLIAPEGNKIEVYVPGEESGSCP